MGVIESKSSVVKKAALELNRGAGDDMINVGFDKPLYILPFDHSGSFQRQMFGSSGELTPEQAAHIVSAKQMVYDGFKTALALGVPKTKASILVDETFGAAVLRDASERGYLTCCPAEKGGHEEFDFEFGNNFAEHVEAFHPTFCKVLVRYNPEGDSGLNKRQSARLKQLSDYLHNQSRSLFMFELLVPPLSAQLQRVNGDRTAYELELRPRLISQAIKQLQDANVEPDVWKVEGLDRRADCERIAAVARAGRRARVGCVILGCGEEQFKASTRLAIAAAVPGFIGFAVSSAIFWAPLTSWRQGKLTREKAMAKIAQRYREYVDVFEGTVCAAA